MKHVVHCHDCSQLFPTKHKGIVEGVLHAPPVLGVMPSFHFSSEAQRFPSVSIAQAIKK